MFHHKNLSQSAKPNTNTLHLYKTIKNYVSSGKLKIIPKPISKKSGACIFYIIDSSGSMIQGRQISFIKGLIESGIKQNSSRSIQYIAVALYQGKAHLVVPETKDPELLINTIQILPSGGKTNMRAALEMTHQLKKKNHQRSQNQLFIFSDCRINEGNTDNPFLEAVEFYNYTLKSSTNVTVIDTESGFIRLGLAEKFADAIGGKYVLIHK